MNRWRELVRERLDLNRRLLGDFLARETPLAGTLPDAGILAFPRFAPTPRHRDVASLCEDLAREAAVVIVPGRFFQRPDHVRIAVGGRPEEVENSLSVLGDFLARWG